MDDGGRHIAQAVEAAPEELSSDELLSILSDRQRRQLLAIFARLETSERVSALTRTLATALDRSGTDEVERLRIRLYHCHIPKLADAGLVTYHDDRNTVELTERGRALVAELDQ